MLLCYSLNLSLIHGNYASTFWKLNRSRVRPPGGKTYKASSYTTSDKKKHNPDKEGKHGATDLKLPHTIMYKDDATISAALQCVTKSPAQKIFCSIIKATDY